MKINWKFLTTTRGILLIVGGILFSFTACAIGLIVFLSQQIGSSDADSDAPQLPVREMTELLFDEKKTAHLGRAEMALYDAITQGVAKKDYKKAHSFMTECVDEAVEAVGENSLITCLFLDIQGDIERGFEKWSIVESIERRLLKAVPDKAQNQTLRTRARRHLAEALEKQNRYDAAVKVYAENVAIAEQIDKQKHSKTFARTERALRPLARCYESNYDYDQAFAVSQKLLAIGANDSPDAQASILCTQGRLRRMQHRYAEALQLLNRALALDNSDSYSLVCRGLIYEDQQNYKAALADFDRALAKADGPYWYFDRRSRLHTAVGQTNEAIDDANQSLKLRPSADGYIMRADAEMKAGLDQEALADYTMALRIEPDYQPAFGRRAVLWEKMSEHDKAIADATRALKPGYLKAQRCLDDDYKVDMTGGKMPLTVLTYEIRSKAYRALKQNSLADADAAAAKKCEQEWRQFVSTH